MVTFVSPGSESLFEIVQLCIAETPIGVNGRGQLSILLPVLYVFHILCEVSQRNKIDRLTCITTELQFCEMTYFLIDIICMQEVKI